MASLSSEPSGSQHKNCLMRSFVGAGDRTGLATSCNTWRTLVGPSSWPGTAVKNSSNSTSTAAVNFRQIAPAPEKNWYYRREVESLHCVRIVCFGIQAASHVKYFMRGRHATWWLYLLQLAHLNGWSILFPYVTQNSQQYVYCLQCFTRYETYTVEKVWLATSLW